MPKGRIDMDKWYPEWYKYNETRYPSLKNSLVDWVYFLWIYWFDILCVVLCVVATVAAIVALTEPL